MAHILEKVKDVTTPFTALEVVAGQVTHLIARAYDYQQMLKSDEEKAIIEGWRNELCSIRYALETMDRPKQ